MKRQMLTFIIFVGLAVSAGRAVAHHGWSWTTGGNIDLIGIIKTVRLGNPHGVLQVDAEGDVWTVEVGQPWRNDRAGLKDGDLAVGKEVRIIGQPSVDPSRRLMKAEKVYLGKREYNLYPGRD